MNLRFMAMAGVKPHQYLLGTGGALLVIGFGAMVVYSQIARFSGDVLINFLLVSAVGSSIAILLGMSIGMFKFPWLGQPIGIMLAFGTMLSEANETLASVFYYTFTMQIFNALASIVEYGHVDMARIMQIMLGNAVVVVILFTIVNWKHGLHKV